MRVVYILLFSLSLPFYTYCNTYIEDKFTRILSSKNIYSYGPQPSEAIKASTIRFAFVLLVPFKYIARKSSRRGCCLINASVLDRLVNICIYTLLKVVIFQKERFVYGFYATYYAEVHPKTPGLYAITCNGIEDYSIEATTGPTDPTCHSVAGPTPTGHMFFKKKVNIKTQSGIYIKTVF